LALHEKTTIDAITMIRTKLAIPIHTKASRKKYDVAMPKYFTRFEKLSEKSVATLFIVLSPES
jgi:hypothetical protein